LDDPLTRVVLDSTKSGDGLAPVIDPHVAEPLDAQVGAKACCHLGKAATSLVTVPVRLSAQDSYGRDSLVQLDLKGGVVTDEDGAGGPECRHLLTLKLGLDPRDLFPRVREQLQKLVGEGKERIGLSLAVRRSHRAPPLGSGGSGRSSPLPWYRSRRIAPSTSRAPIVDCKSIAR
jgi:hypothetical protein